MYLALTSLRLRQPDCTVKTVQVGDEIKDFGDWPEWTQQAMLRQRQVRWAPEGLAPHEKQEAERVVVQHLPNNPVGPPPAEYVEDVEQPEFVAAMPKRPNIPKMNAMVVNSEEDALPVKKGVVKAKPGESIIMPTAAHADPGGGRIKVDSDLPAKGAHDCTECGRQGFKDFNGLRIHMARAHKKE